MGIKVSEMVTEDTKVLADGSVVGTFPYVTGFKGFNEGNKEEQEGHYFPLRLTKTGKKMTIKKNGATTPEKQDMDFDQDVVLRVENNDTVFEIEVDGSKIVKLNFKKATLQEKSD